MIDIALQNNHQDARLPIDVVALKPIITQVLTYFDKQKNSERQHNYEIGIACVDCQYSQQLNATYRHKDKPTNVLSFASDIDEDILEQLDSIPLGDLVICIPVVLKEADEQNKTPWVHFTHLVVHGVLHLLGFDHETSTEDAEAMEAMEIAILAQLHIANPYIDHTGTQGVKR